jgi:thioredoxin-disulfide reductase
LTESIYLSEICKKVYLIHRRNEFRAENTWIEQAKKRENIEFILNDEVEEIV